MEGRKVKSKQWLIDNGFLYVCNSREDIEVWAKLIKHPSCVQFTYYSVTDDSFVEPFETIVG